MEKIGVCRKVQVTFFLFSSLFSDLAALYFFSQNAFASPSHFSFLLLCLAPFSQELRRERSRMLDCWTEARVGERDAENGVSKSSCEKTSFL